MSDLQKISKESVWGLDESQLANICLKTDVALANAQNFLKYTYKNNGLVAKKFLHYINENFNYDELEISKTDVSSLDGSIKVLVKMKDDLEVETVIIPEKNRVTLCVSSQVGCQQGCRFCHTARMGLVRNLRTHEIVGQLRLAQRLSQKKITNIVFMGMGEPLDNVESVVSAVRIFTNPLTYGFAKRKISISTVGHLDGLKKLLELEPSVPVAFSIHAATDSLRSKIIPANKVWSLKSIIEQIVILSQKKDILIQYTLMDGVNDTEFQAQEMVKLFLGLKVKINIIPYNEISSGLFRKPSIGNIQKFRDILHKGGLRTLVRFSKGSDIAAACGQLLVSESA